MFNLIRELKSYKVFDKNEQDSVEQTIRFLENNVNCFDRSNLKGHITAGALVCDKEGNILLNHHKKSGMWFQFGGHCDGEEDCINVARREIMEEAGIENFVFGVPSIFDVAIMDIPYSVKKSEPEHKHYDVNFLFIVDTKSFDISNESVEIRWVTIDEAKELIDQNDVGMQRMIKKYENWFLSKV
ncbi:MAG: NUDIX hydrolase [Clostridia bacterium]|nr:NUDIX hydrolase [Clostridia bacterium]